ncbi:MAG: hypothetical protein ACR2H2_15630, partial [Solirubrobacteraceae bacterium]
RNSCTASRLNSLEYDGVFGIDRHPSRPSKLSQQVSTKPGELQITSIQWVGFALTEAIVFYAFIFGLIAYFLP